MKLLGIGFEFRFHQEKTPMANYIFPLEAEMVTKISKLNISMAGAKDLLVFNGRVVTSSEKAGTTCSNPNFRKTDISETHENKNFGKSRLSQGLSRNC